MDKATNANPYEYKLLLNYGGSDVYFESICQLMFSASISSKAAHAAFQGVIHKASIGQTKKKSFFKAKCMNCLLRASPPF
jgi:hypothetical protein